MDFSSFMAGFLTAFGLSFIVTIIEYVVKFLKQRKENNKDE